MAAISVSGCGTGIEDTTTGLPEIRPIGMVSHVVCEWVVPAGSAVAACGMISTRRRWLVK